MKIFCDDCGERKRRGACWQKGDDRVDWIERMSKQYAIRHVDICALVTEFIVTEDQLETYCQIAVSRALSIRQVLLDSVHVRNLLIGS